MTMKTRNALDPWDVLIEAQHAFADMDDVTVTAEIRATDRPAPTPGQSLVVHIRGEGRSLSHAFEREQIEAMVGVAAQAAIWRLRDDYLAAA